MVIIFVLLGLIWIPLVALLRLVGLFKQNRRSGGDGIVNNVNGSTMVLANGEKSARNFDSKL